MKFVFVLLLLAADMMATDPPTTLVTGSSDMVDSSTPEPTAQTMETTMVDGATEEPTATTSSTSTTIETTTDLVPDASTIVEEPITSGKYSAETTAATMRASGNKITIGLISALVIYFLV